MLKRKPKFTAALLTHSLKTVKGRGLCNRCRSWFWGVTIYIYVCMCIYIYGLGAIHLTFRSLSQQVHIGVFYFIGVYKVH